MSTSVQLPQPAADEVGRARTSDPFAIFKWKWLDQVAADPDLPPAAHRVAILIAGRYLNRKSGEAWPGIEKLAADLSIKSTNTVRTGLKAMEVGGHMTVRWSAGGKSQTNHFWPLVAGKPFKNLKGMEKRNPSILEADTLQNREAKPFKNLKGNPLKEPFDEPSASDGGPLARQSSAYMPRSSSYGEGVVARPEGAPPPRHIYVGLQIDHEALGLIEIQEIFPHARKVLVRLLQSGMIREVSVRPDDLFVGSTVTDVPTLPASPSRRASRRKVANDPA